MIDRIRDGLQEAKLKEAQRQWASQAQRLIQSGYHRELGISEGEYRTEVPPLQLLPSTLPVELRRRFIRPVLVDPRVSLLRQLQLHKVSLDSTTTEADVANLSFDEAKKTYIPQHLYQIWISEGTMDESAVTFRQNDRSLTGIEGLALLREYPKSFKFRVSWEDPQSYLIDEKTGRKIPVMRLEQTICADTTKPPSLVMALYRCLYAHERKTGMKAGVVYWDITTRAKFDIVPCTLGMI